MSWTLWLAAPVIGLVLSLFAAGGGMIAVPLLQKKRWHLIEWLLYHFFAMGTCLAVLQGQVSG